MTQRYVVLRNRDDGHLRAWCSVKELEQLIEFERTLENEKLEGPCDVIEFDGPDYDGTDECFAEVNRIAESHCVPRE